MHLECSLSALATPWTRGWTQSPASAHKTMSRDRLSFLSAILQIGIFLT
jgi:hypothetical protein